MHRKVCFMEFQNTPLSGLLIAKPKRFIDARGYFMETYNQEEFKPHIGDVTFIQDNESESTKGVIRGLHLQTGKDSQAKLVRVVEGAVFDVVVDLRPNSETFGRWFGLELSHENGLNLFIPRGFAHGFMVISSHARFVYKVDNYYAPQSEVTVAFDDPELSIEWPRLDSQRILSVKDIEKAISLKKFRELYCGIQ